MPRLQSLSSLAGALFVGLLLAEAAPADDSALFSTVVPPNVVLLVDNSGSMHHVVWHPAFDPTVTPACQYWNDDTQYFVASFSGDNWPSGATDTTFKSGDYDLGSIGDPACDNKREIFHDKVVDDNGDYTRWSGRYLNWYFSDAADAYADDIEDKDNGKFSACLGGGKFHRYRRARIHAAQDILREVICQVNASGDVRFGMAQFRRGGDPNGGYIRVPATDYLDGTGSPNVYTLNGVSQSHGEHLDDAIDDLTGEAWTPLAESLFQVYTYFMSRDAADRPVGADASTVFPEYEYTTSFTNELGGPFSGSGAPTVPDSPIQYACQKNFVVVITDGEPTKDDFDVNTPTSTARGFADFLNLIGDYNPDAEDELPGSFPGCTGCEATRWLDDIAKFMQENDVRPDIPAHGDQEQVIDVYTVGFTTSPFANEILEKTAQQGNGEFYYSTDPESLAGDIIDAITDIIRKSQSFTAATVPAVRASSGSRFYTSRFVPSNMNGFWEGHLESWTITPGGEIRDRFDQCALEDPAAPAQCVEGPFKDSAEPHWDAADVLKAAGPASRNLYTTRVTGSGTSSLVPFTTAAIDKDDLDVSNGDIPLYIYTPYLPPLNDQELTDLIVDAVRGCEFGTSGAGCPVRTSVLGDIFHSSPAVIPGPQSFLQDPSYQAFESHYEHRPRVLVAGANDGFLHVFDAGSWDAGAGEYTVGTGSEIAGFMPYAARQVIKHLPNDSNGRTYYTVDGSPSVADVWLYPSPTQNSPKDGTDWGRWRTVLVGGLRQGGKQLYALDVTDPAGPCQAPATGPGYPCYLWEFPREDAPDGGNDDRTWMGQTWSEPVIAKVKVDPSGSYTQSYDRWVAIFGAGYDPTGDPNDHVNYDAKKEAGRAIFMVDLVTGEVLARKRFDDDGTPSSDSDPATLPYDPAVPEESMHYAIASTPSVFDLDFDGYADVVYVGDLGGNVWKWVIHEVGDDPIHGSGDPDQPRWPLSRFFSAPTYLDTGTGNRFYKSIFFAPSATFKSRTLWLAFGTGERANLPFLGLPAPADENNRFYAVTDLDPLERLAPPAAPTLGEGDLVDLTAFSGSACTDVSAFRGFYVKGEDGEKFVTQSDIFFYYAFVASYIPAVSPNPCDTAGDSKLYGFKVYCGEGLFDSDGNGSPESSISLGTGVPSDPKLTISTGGDGGAGGPSPNRVIISKQDGDLETTDAPPGFGDGIGQFYWRELSN